MGHSFGEEELMNWQELWTNYSQLVVVVVTVIATLIATKVLPWLWRNVVVRLWKSIIGHYSVRGFQREYLDWLIEEHRFLDITRIRTKFRVSPELENLYVPLRATATVPRTHVSLGAATGESGGGEDKRALEIGKIISSEKRVVILGDPGSGKTTILRYLVLSFARMMRGDKSEGDQRRQIYRRMTREGLNFSPTQSFFRRADVPLPLFVPLRKLPLEKLDGPDGLELANLCIGRHLHKDRIDSVDWLRHALRDGKCIILLDGLDEVGDQERRRQAVRWVEELVAAFPNNRYILTSRIASYTTPLAGGFAEATLQDFSDGDIVRFLYNWYQSVEIASKDPSETVKRAANKSANQLVEAIFEHHEIRRLAVNPLLLSIIAMVHRSKVVLPKRRANLYDECTQVLLEHWDEAKGITGILSAQQKRLLLEPIAAKMHFRDTTELSRQDVEAILEAGLPSVGIDQRLASEFLDMVRERSGLLIERAPDVFSFAHLTFQEYLAARHLLLIGEEELLLEHATDEKWREVVLLYSGTTTDASQFVSKLLAEPDDIFHTRLLLAGQCASEALRISPKLRTEITESLSELASTSAFAPCRIGAIKILGILAPEITIDSLLKRYRVAAGTERLKAARNLAVLYEHLPSEVVVELLRSDEVEVRVSILEIVAEQWNPLAEVASEALNMLSAEEPVIRELAVRTLGDGTHSTAYQAIAQHLLADESASVREQAAIALRYYRDRAVFAHAALGLYDSDANVIGEAGNSVEYLFSVLPRKRLLILGFLSAIALIKLLFVKPYRQNALMGLGTAFLGAVVVISSVPVFALHLNYGSSMVSKAVRKLYRGWYWLLASIAYPVVKVITRSAEEARFLTLFFRCITAYGIGDKDPVAFVSRYLTSDNKKHQLLILRSTVLIEADARLKFNELAAALATATSDDVGVVAARRLFDAAPEYAMRSFRALLENHTAMIVRKSVLEILPSAKEHLIRDHLQLARASLRDEDPEVRKAACRALGRLKDSESVDTLIPLLRDEALQVKIQACRALGQIGDRTSLEHLLPLLDNEQTDVRDAAYESLLSICRQTGVWLLPGEPASD